MIRLEWVIDKIFFLGPLLFCSLLAGKMRARCRSYFMFRLIGCIAAIITIEILWRLFVRSGGGLFNWISLLNYFLQYILAIATVWICLECNFWTALFCATVGYCIEHCAQRIYYIFYKASNIELHIAVHYLIRASLFAAVCLSVYFLLIKRGKYAKSSIGTNNLMQVILAMLIVLIIIFINSRAIAESHNAGATKAIIYIQIMSLLFAIVGIVLEYSISAKQSSEEEFDIIQHILYEERQRYYNEKRNIELVHIKCHDIRHQLSAYKEKLDEQEREKILEIVDMYDRSLDTGNDALNTVISEKSLLCKNNGIRLSCLVDGTKLGFLPPTEIYSLFSNALENAIHAVMPLESEKKVISITDTGDDNLVNILIENYFTGEIAFADNLPLTKGDTSYHGYGMKSMRYIVEKYGGVLRTSVDREVFILEILVFAPPD